MWVILQIVVLLVAVVALWWILRKGISLLLEASLRHEIRRRYQYSLESLPQALVPHKEQVLLLVRPCVRFNVEHFKEGESDDPLLSKFGGMPFLQSATDWPTTGNGTPMTFVAQVNLEQTSRELTQDGRTLPADLPNRGVLQLFGAFLPEGAGQDPNDWWRIRWIPEPGNPAVPATVPAGPQVVKHRRLTARLSVSLPSPFDGHNPPAFLDTNEALKEPYRKLLAGVAGPGGTTYLLGYADWTQGDPRLLSGFHPFCDNPSSWRLLWEIEDEEVVPLGDAGILYILIRDEDLRAGRLGSAVALNEQA